MNDSRNFIYPQGSLTTGDINEFKSVPIFHLSAQFKEKTELLWKIVFFSLFPYNCSFLFFYDISRNSVFGVMVKSPGEKAVNCEFKSCLIHENQRGNLRSVTLSVQFTSQGCCYEETKNKGMKKKQKNK